MIKSEIVKAESANEYPKMMIDAFGVVVLFLSERKGTVIHSAEPQSYEVGYYSSSWRMHIFKDLESGEVVSIKQC